MSSATLFRLGGAAAILAGLLRSIAAFFPSANPTPALELLYFFTDVFILFGILGLYGFQHKEVGLWGFFGFLLATVGIGSIIGPEGNISGIDLYAAGASTFVLGLSLFAVGTWRANILPRWIPACWMLSTIIGFIGFFTPGLNLMFIIAGVMFGVGYAGAGLKTISAAGIAGRTKAT